MPQGSARDVQTKDADTQACALRSCPPYSSVGRNTVHAACLVLATEERRLHTAMIEGTTRPLRHMHGLTLTTLAEGPEATAHLYASWAGGSWLQPLVATFESLHNLELMSKCGFAVDMEDMPLEAAAGAVWAPDFGQGTRYKAGLSVNAGQGRAASTCQRREGPQHQAEFQNSLGQTWWRFIVALVRARCWSMCWHSECLPGVLAGLLHPDQDVQERTRARLKRWHAAVEAALGQQQPVPLRAARRSPLESWAWLFLPGTSATQPSSDKVGSSLAEPRQQQVVKCAMAALARCHFQQTPADVEAVARHIFSSFGSTKLCEDAFRDLRRQETQHQGNKTVSRHRRWYTCVSSDLLASWKRSPLELATLDLCGPAPPIPPATVYESSPASDPHSLQLPSMTDSLSWPTFTPASAQGLAAELQFLTHLHETEQWSQASGAWRAAFFMEGSVYQDLRKGHCYVSLGHNGSCGPAVLGWPVTRHTYHDNLTVFELDHSAALQGEVQWLIPLRWEDWAAWPCEVLCPLAVHLAGAASPAHAVSTAASSSTCPRRVAPTRGIVIKAAAASEGEK